MRAKLLYLTISSLCIFNYTANAQAENNYSRPSNNGYYSGGSAHNGHNDHSQEHHKDHKKDRDSFSISINLPIQNETVTLTNHGFRPHHREPVWISMRPGMPIPDDAVIGGSQPRPQATLFVCHAYYRNGLHPGKLFNGRCNISWGGSEISMNRYEVLTSRAPLNWISANFGSIPPRAIQGGYQQNGPLFICQANYRGGTHIGKVVGQNCNFGWGGQEITIPRYNVLTG